MKWKDERNQVLARLDDLERRLAALEADGGDPEPDPVAPVDPVDPVDPVVPVDPVPNRDAALESAWSAVMNGDSGVQVAIVNPNDPRYNGGPFVVEDNRENVKGEGDSVPEAFDDYKARGGKGHGDPSPLDDFEYAQAEFFCTPDNISAPTSTRHSNVGYFCDFFRKDLTPDGGHKVGPFDTPGKAIQALRDELGGDL